MIKVKFLTKAPADLEEMIWSYASFERWFTHLVSALLTLTHIAKIMTGWSFMMTPSSMVKDLPLEEELFPCKEKQFSWPQNHLRKPMEKVLSTNLAMFSRVRRNGPYPIQMQFLAKLGLFGFTAIKDLTPYSSH